MSQKAYYPECLEELGTNPNAIYDRNGPIENHGRDKFLREYWGNIKIPAPLSGALRAGILYELARIEWKARGTDPDPEAKGTTRGAAFRLAYFLGFEEEELEDAADQYETLRGGGPGPGEQEV